MWRTLSGFTWDSTVSSWPPPLSDPLGAGVPREAWDSTELRRFLLVIFFKKCPNLSKCQSFEIKLSTIKTKHERQIQICKSEFNGLGKSRLQENIKSLLMNFSFSCFASPLYQYWLGVPLNTDRLRAWRSLELFRKFWCGIRARWVSKVNLLGCLWFFSSFAWIKANMPKKTAKH